MKKKFVNLNFEEKFWNQRVCNVPDACIVVGDVNETDFDKQRGSLLPDIMKIEIFMESKVNLKHISKRINHRNFA